MKPVNILKVTLLSATLVAMSACSDGHKKKTTTPPPAAPVAQKPTGYIDNYQQFLEENVGEVVPGVILSIDGPSVNFIGAAGLSDTESSTSMQTYDVMPAGSAGKKATALLVAMLHNDGVLNIDDTLDTWLSDDILSHIPNSESITLRMLLNHTAGVHDYLDPDTQDDWFGWGIENIDTLKTDQIALQFVYDKPSYFAPGSSFKYSNTGYVLAGLILDEILGEHHSIALRNRILIPLGMNDTFNNGVENDMGDIISGYLNDGTEILNTKPFYRNVAVSDAPLATTVSDLSLLLRSILTDDTVITEDIREIMLGEESLLETQYDFAYGLGLFKEDIDGFTVYHHGGDEAGYKTANLYIEDLDTTVTMFANCNGYQACIDQTDDMVQQVLLTLFTQE